MALEQTGPSHERKLAVIDKNRDLYLVRCGAPHPGHLDIGVLFILSVTLASVRARAGSSAGKLGAMVQSLRWSSDCSMLAAMQVLYCTVLQCTVLAAMQDSRFTLWCLPAIITLDRALLARTTVERDSAEFGKYPVITGFENNSVAVRRGDGSLVVTGVSPYPAILHGYAASQHWEDATKLCRFVKDPVLWACLAGMAVHAKHLDTAEVAYAAIQEADKVHYIQVRRYYSVVS